jgi:hypothetical protein
MLLALTLSRQAILREKERFFFFSVYIRRYSKFPVLNDKMAQSLKTKIEAHLIGTTK